MTKKRLNKDNNSLYKSLLGLHVPQSYLEYFELVDVRDKTDCWELLLDEKRELIPEGLSDADVVLDGFCNEISVLSHSFSLKKIYLIIRRRRWKKRGSRKHYSNQYDLHCEGAKITEEFADFLKGGD